MPEPAIPAAMQPVDADVDLHVPAHRRELTRAALPVLAVISLGGMLGALGRHGLAAAFPHSAVEFPWATFVVNVAGCALIGVLMVVIDQLGAHRLVCPFSGSGCWVGSPPSPPT
ncbi:MAG TPA: CrcB family protein [Pseudonocardiaceae bacterium]|nr:CrcB family protein [Pseudonocardiaceae bacterium]